MAEGKVDSGDREDFRPGLFGSRAVVPGPGWLAVALAGALDEPTLDALRPMSGSKPAAVFRAQRLEATIPRLSTSS